MVERGLTECGGGWGGGGERGGGRGGEGGEGGGGGRGEGEGEGGGRGGREERVRGRGKTESGEGGERMYLLMLWAFLDGPFFRFPAWPGLAFSSSPLLALMCLSLSFFFLSFFFFGLLTGA